MFSRLIAATLLMSASIAMAQQQNPNLTQVPSVTANANAEVRVAPDLATVRIGAVAQASTAQAAQNEVNKNVQAFLTRARALIGDKGTIETGHISLSPVYTQPTNRIEEFTPRISGYRAYNMVVVELTDFSLIGPVIDAAVEVGLNNIESVSFGLRDDRAARLDALRQAVQKAREKAGVMAEAAGVQLGQLLDLNEGGAQVMPYMMETAALRADMGGGGVPTPVLPGMVTVHAMVTIRYGIR